MTQSPPPLKEQLKALELVQELDLKIDAINKKKRLLPEELKTTEDLLKKTQVTIDAKKTTLEELEKNQRQIQAALELNRDRVSRANSKLDSVQNSQEFQAANKEIDQLKKLNASLDEHLAKSKQEGEVIHQELEKFLAEKGKAQEELDAQSGNIAEQSKQLDREIETLLKDRTAYVQRVETRIVRSYDRIRVARNGIGIAPTLGGRCGGCHMMVPPQLYNEVQKTIAIQCCPSCHRILFIPAAPEEAPQISQQT